MGSAVHAAGQRAPGGVPTSIAFGEALALCFEELM